MSFKSKLKLMIFSTLSALAMLSPDAYSMSKTEPLETVAYVDIQRYLGTWYEIVRLPQWFEKDCTAVTANYALKSNGDIRVTNTCRKFTPTGEEKVSVGVAKVVDKQSNSKLKVSFFGPFYGPYWILELGQDYEYAVVGSPDRQTLWILSRTPRMDESVIQEILERRVAQGFDISTLERTVQP